MKNNFFKSLFFMVFLFFNYISFSHAGIDDGIVAYYPFNGNVRDQSGNALDGILSGPIPISDKFGNANSAYGFDGLNDFIKVLNSQNLNFSNGQISVSAWINLNGFVPAYDNQNRILNKQDQNNDKREYDLLVRFDTHKAIFSINQDGTKYGWKSVESTNPLLIGKWYHIVGVNDGLNISIYINGVLEGQNIGAPSQNKCF